MLGTVFYVATAVLGVAVGWEVDDREELVYIIQVEPEAVESMLEGTPVEYNIPPEHLGVRRFRFQIGRDLLPQPIVSFPLQVKEKSVEQPDTTDTPKNQQSPNNDGYQPLPDPQDLKIDSQPEERPKFDLFGPHDQSAVNTSTTDATGSELKPLPSNTESHPLNAEQLAAYTQPVKQKEPPAEKESAPATENSSTMSLVIAWCAAAGLLAALAYLLWIHLGMRRQYKNLLADYHSAVGHLPGERAKPAAV